MTLRARVQIIETSIRATVSLHSGIRGDTPHQHRPPLRPNETGGLAIENVDEADENPTGEQAEDIIPIFGSDLSMSIDWTTNGHTGAATPITAEGAGANRFSGVLRNTDVHDAIQRAMRLPRG